MDPINLTATDLATVGYFQRDKDQLRENAETAQRVLAEG